MVIIGVVSVVVVVVVVSLRSFVERESGRGERS